MWTPLTGSGARALDLRAPRRWKAMAARVSPSSRAESRRAASSYFDTAWGDLHVSCTASASVSPDGIDTRDGRHPMNERVLADLIGRVKAGGLSRRAFVKRMATVGLTAPMA